MGKERMKDMTIDPNRKGGMIAQTTISNLSPDDIATQGALVIGNYKGNAAFLDLDKLANQPLVAAEKGHILGILDGREEDYDLQTAGIALAEAVGTSHVTQLTVPTGATWYVSAIISTLPASGGANIIEANWYCSLWTDRLGSLGYGQAFHAAAFNFNVGGGIQYDEFGVVPVLWAATNKEQPLRLPAGTVLTFIATNTTAVAAAAVNATFQVYGYVGKSLVA